MLRNEDKTWGMACHLAALCAYLGIPFGHIIGPLIVWMVKKNESAFVDDQGKESLNFQISMTIYIAIAGILAFLLIGIPALIVLGIAHLILTIIGAIRASNGEQYRYPFTIRFVN